MKRLLLGVSLAVLAHAAAHAQAITPSQSLASFGPAPSSACPYYQVTYDDGCPGANPNAFFSVQSYYGTSFYTHAATSGQTWTSPHPWTCDGTNWIVG